MPHSEPHGRQPLRPLPRPDSGLVPRAPAPPPPQPADAVTTDGVATSSVSNFVTSDEVASDFVATSAVSGVVSADRRRLRTDARGDALMLALSCSAERGSLAAVLVADEQGSIVAQSESPLDLRIIAAVAPIVGDGRAAANVRHHGIPTGLSVTRVAVGDESLYVAALGGSPLKRSQELDVSRAATYRILAS